MCKSSTTSSSTQLPGYVTSLGSQLSSAGSSTLGTSLPTYDPSKMVAGFSPDQQSAFQNVRDMVANTPQGLGQNAIASAMQYGQAPAQSVSTNGVMDPNSPIGSVESYINPGVQASLAPTLRNIQNQHDIQNQKIASQATGAGAFGDARQGVQQGFNDQTSQLAMQDASSNAYNNAFNQAMQNRQTDLSRINTDNLANAQFNETALQRLLQSGTAALAGAQGQQNLTTNADNSLLSTGATQQQNDQQKANAAYQQFMQQYFGNPQWQQQMAAQDLAANKGTMDTTTTNTQPNNAILGMLGALGGSTLGSNGFWNFMNGGNGNTTTTNGTQSNGGWTTSVTPVSNGGFWNWLGSR